MFPSYFSVRIVVRLVLLVLLPPGIERRLTRRMHNDAVVRQSGRISSQILQMKAARIGGTAGPASAKQV
jgi:hypothetical protein